MHRFLAMPEDFRDRCQDVMTSFTGHALGFVGMILRFSLR